MRNFSLSYGTYGMPVEQLRLEMSDLPAVQPSQLRVKMSYAPINPSDLIPISGAYAHRIKLPAIAGYEGVGTVISAPASHAALIGTRVLPLRGVGTWQTYVDCDPALAIPVPASMNDLTAARAYINPLAALNLLNLSPVAGKRVLLCGAGSTCAELLGQWALQQGATAVHGIYRSQIRVERLLAKGIEPIYMEDTQRIKKTAEEADITFDSLGGQIGAAVLHAMPKGSVFVGYGLLSGQSIRPADNPLATYRRFHLRDTLGDMPAAIWQSQFLKVWDALSDIDLPSVEIFPFYDWEKAIRHTFLKGLAKPMIRF